MKRISVPEMSYIQIVRHYMRNSRCIFDMQWPNDNPKKYCLEAIALHPNNIECRDCKTNEKVFITLYRPGIIGTFMEQLSDEVSERNEYYEDYWQRN